MESSGSTSSNFLVDPSLSRAIRVDKEKLGHKTPTASSHTPSSATKREQEVSLPATFKCKLCPRAFNSARALGGHQKAHSTLLRPLRDNQKAHMRRRPSWCSVATALRSACLHARPFDAWHIHYDPSVPFSFRWETGTGPAGGPARAQPSSAVLADEYGENGEGALLGRQQAMSEVDQEETPNGIDLTLKL
ncbi:hypothetical protein D1007_42692 [Hordeum vulgare]|nr:hypothetical protein D1007_42692 [Hordeum vulgare]KAI4991343.1 hypothetical protein ZWY2020_039714 [Hordeum vulgare]